MQWLIVNDYILILKRYENMFRIHMELVTHWISIKSHTKMSLLMIVHDSHPENPTEHPKLAHFSQVFPSFFLGFS